MFSVPLQYTVSNGKMISEYTIGKDMKGRDNVLTEKLSCNLPGWTHDNHYNLSGQFIPKLRYKMDTSHIQVRSTTVETTCSMHVSYDSLTKFCHTCRVLLSLYVKMNTPWPWLPNEQCFPHSLPWLVAPHILVLKRYSPLPNSKIYSPLTYSKNCTKYAQYEVATSKVSKIDSVTSEPWKTTA